MGSTMKPSIFDERVAKALRNWHQTAKKNIKKKSIGTSSASVTPMSSMPTSPNHPLSPVHLLRYYRSELDSLSASPRRSNGDIDSNSHHQHEIEIDPIDDPTLLDVTPSPSCCST